MTLRWYYLFPAAALAFATVVIACKGTETTYVDDDSPDDDDATGDASMPPPDSGLGLLDFRPSEMYSGFDGTHPFKVPFAIYDAADDLVVTASNPAAVTLEKVELKSPVTENGTDLGKYYMATIKAAGDVTLTAKSGGKTKTSVLHVATYTAAAWTAGETRYKTGVTGDDQNPPCTSCHVNGEAIDHSPAALVSVTDEKVGFIISTGLSTNNRPITIDAKYKDGHKWKTTDAAEQAALVVYLRGLEPRGFKTPGLK